ncbi:glucose-6-phosphate isomerase [Flaviramulus basaltis]|uniref:glucose-6-phosphate isomerase n=1 Tax=Flaviramulus basaltis TaxID=369401 RepID=A0A1K2IMF6_9FLAO|nr:glucose-6-phosphate isomerase family protein [Flaviramulus basaltis]SFZ93551.1 glucose-6-phosphate isomerase [Flaviramulus basaltis]
MEKFKSGLNIISQTSPLGFKYGEDCFGPEIENRKLKDIRKSLMDINCDGPDIVYSIAMDVGKKEHYQKLKEQHLLFGIVTYAKGKLGKEPIRSQGHIHKKSTYGQGWSTPEVYQIWSGKAVIYMQEYADDNPGKCYAVFAEVGDIIIVPPEWAHATISADVETPLTFGAWCDLEYGFEYDKIRAHNGLAWFPLILDTGELTWVGNDNYEKSTLIIKSPNNYDEFGIEEKKSIYKQYEENNDLFLFVPKPYLKKEIWRNFIP